MAKQEENSKYGNKSPISKFKQFSDTIIPNSYKFSDVNMLKTIEGAYMVYLTYKCKGISLRITKNADDTISVEGFNIDTGHIRKYLCSQTDKQTIQTVIEKTINHIGM